MAKKKAVCPRSLEPPPRMCDLCGRAKLLTVHHLLPRAIHKRKRFVAKFGKEELKGRKLYLCRLCHNGIHDLIPSEKTLAEEFNTKELLLAHEGVQRHVAWVRKQK